MVLTKNGTRKEGINNLAVSELIRIVKVRNYTLSNFDLPFVVALSVSIVAVILTYIDMRRRLKQEREFSKSMANLINTLREELELFRKQSRTSEDIQRQRLLAQREQQQWNRIKDFASAIGWILEHAEDDEE